MISLSMAIWRDWRDHVAAATIAPAAILCALTVSFASLSPLMISGVLSGASILGGWFAGRRYGPGSFGRERFTRFVSESGRRGTGFGLALSSLSAWICVITALAPALALLVYSWRLGSTRLILFMTASMGPWFLSWGGAFVSSILKSDETSAPGWWMCLLWLIPTALVPVLRFLNPFIIVWRAIGGDLIASVLYGSTVLTAAGICLMVLGSSVFKRSISRIEI